MKQKFLYMVVVAALLTSCGSKKTDNSIAEESALVDTTTIVQTDEISEDNELAETTTPADEQIEENTNEEEGIYNPPFKVTVIREYRDGGWMYKDTYVFNVLKQGRLTGTSKYERRDVNFGGWEPLGETTEFGGKWSTSSISMGDGRMKVYVLDRSDRESSIYLPATCDYIWMCDYAWLECENWNLEKAMKVTSVEKL